MRSSKAEALTIRLSVADLAALWHLAAGPRPRRPALPEALPRPHRARSPCPHAESGLASRRIEPRRAQALCLARANMDEEVRPGLAFIEPHGDVIHASCLSPRHFCTSSFDTTRNPSRVKSVRRNASPSSSSGTVSSTSRMLDYGHGAGYPRASVVPSEKHSYRGDPREASALALPVMETGCGQMRNPPDRQKRRQQ